MDTPPPTWSHLPILPKEFYQLGIKYSNIWTYGFHSHPSHHNEKYSVWVPWVPTMCLLLEETQVTFVSGLMTWIWNGDYWSWPIILCLLLASISGWWLCECVPWFAGCVQAQMVTVEYRLYLPECVLGRVGDQSLRLAWLIPWPIETECPKRCFYLTMMGKEHRQGSKPGCRKHCTRFSNFSYLSTTSQMVLI